jgi:CubicO group peptidase (beta-lactamase class C family)
VCLLILVSSFALSAIYRPDRAIRVATGYVAHNLCSKTFVSGLDPQTTFSEAIDREGIRSLRLVLRYRLDRPARAVEVSTFGLFGSRTDFHEGFGCVPIHGSAPPYLLKSDLEALKTARTPPLLPEIAGPSVVEPSDPALRAALDHAFEELTEPPFRRTKAVVVVRDGRVIAERYAKGIGVDTPLLGFSMTKSVVSALIGIMTQRGLTSPSLPAPIREWRAPTDPRREIEVGHLLRMTSGLALDETNSGFDPSSQMVFLQDDMAGFAVRASLIAWHALALFQRHHGNPGKNHPRRRRRPRADARLCVAGTLQPAWDARDVTLEFDAAGTVQGTYMLASARDWARFGLLYLYDGEVGGKRILHEDWVDYSAAATLDFRLWRGLLDQSQRASLCLGPHSLGDSA